MRDDVFILYGFVRKADDLVDSIPQNIEGFSQFKNEFYAASAQGTSNDVVIDSFVKLMKRKLIPLDWPAAFLTAMETDTHKQSYRSISELLGYMYGSAEVVGLMMAKIMNLPPSSYPAAQMLGRAMQFINFIRDLEEDMRLHRQYLPTETLSMFNLDALTPEEAHQKPEAFLTFIHNQIEMYEKWQSEAEIGFSLIPKRYRIAIKTASDMYRWTAQQIERHPMRIFEHRIKPSIIRIILTGIKNALIPNVKRPAPSYN